MDIEFSGKYDQQTFFKAVELASRPSGWIAVLRLGLFIFILGLLILLAVLMANGQISSPLGMVKNAVTAVIVLGYLIYPYIKYRRMANQLWKDPTTRGHLEGHVNGLGIEVESVDATIQWDDIAHVRKTSDLVSLLTEGGVLVVLPKQFFACDRDWNLFLQMVEDRVHPIK